MAEPERRFYVNPELEGKNKGNECFKKGKWQRLLVKLHICKHEQSALSQVSLTRTFRLKATLLQMVY